jgi:predicted N-formylglutamate amidohydrolase
MVALAKENCSSHDDVVEVINPSGKGGFLLVCEHASNFIPPEYENLGLGSDGLLSHVAWDPGALAVAEEISTRLDAPLVAQRVSRLVYDCNRPPESQNAIPAKSEIFEVPGNIDLSQSQRQARIDQFYVPFQHALTSRIDRHISQIVPPVLITIHTFTPVYHGVERNLDIGVLHDSDNRFADELLISLEQETHFKIARNAPYGPADGVTHTLVQHALPRGLMNVMIEIRNDIVDTPGSQREMGEILARHLTEVLAGLTANP